VHANRWGAAAVADGPAQKNPGVELGDTGRDVVQIGLRSAQVNLYGGSVTVRLHAARSKLDRSAAIRTLIERGLKSDRDL
jgi:hypothetical protein